MKSFGILIVVLLAVFTVTSEARRTKSKHTRNEESQDDDGGTGPGSTGSGGFGGFPALQGPQGSGSWPTPGSVANFGVPDAFTQNGGAANSDIDGEDESPSLSSGSGKHHGGKSHHKEKRA